MRFSKFILILIASITTSFVCHAQYEEYYKVDDNTTVVTKPKAELYLLPEAYHAAVASGDAFSYGVRDVVDIADVKPKKIGKSQQFHVVRYTNVAKQRNFNAYIVEYKDKLWVLKEEHVEDNSMLAERSEQMCEHKNRLSERHQQQFEAYTSAQQEYDKLTSRYKQEFSDSISYYRTLKQRLPVIRDSLIERATDAEEQRVNSEYQAWYNSQPLSTQKALKAIQIISAELDYPNYVGGCDYYLEYINLSPKTIKYLTWSGTVYNGVGDPAYCEIRRTATCSGREVGPIAQDEYGGGTWDCVVYNYDAELLKLSNISITYMDGSSLSISGDDIRRMGNEPSLEVEIDKVEAISGVMTDKECQSRLSMWQDRYDRVLRGTLQDGTYTYSKNEYKDTWLKLKEIKADIDTLLKSTTDALEESQKYNKFLEYRSYATRQETSVATKSSASQGGGSTSAQTAKSPFVTFGIEGSIEGLKSFSGGIGFSLRFGRYNSLFSATVGLKYQSTMVFETAEYPTPGYTYLTEDATYMHKANEFVVPAILNLNFSRDKDLGVYFGAGYEYGFLLSEKSKFFDMSYDFVESEFWDRGDCSDWKTMSIPTRAVVLQMGFGTRYVDWKVYYKIYTNRKQFINGTPGALGTALTFYF